MRADMRASAGGVAAASRRSALVTGAAGFVGQWLARRLLADGWRVTGVSLDGAPVQSIALADDERAAISWLAGDLRDPGTITAAIDRAQPDAVFHLAGVASVPAAAAHPESTLDVNAGIVVRLLHALRDRRSAGTLDPVVLVVGSAEQYGAHDAGEIPLRETTPCAPRSFYGASKLAQEVLALAACREDGIRVVCTRSFNHSGPGQPARFLVPALVTRALALRGVTGSTLEMGNVHPVRDFLHVADVADAYVTLAERGTPGEVYNVCSGDGVSAGDLAREILDACDVQAAVVRVPSMSRRTDVPTLVGSNDKLCSATGWTPRRSRADIIHDLIHAASR